MKDVLMQGQDRTGAFRPARVDAAGRMTPGYLYRDATSTGRVVPTRGQETALIAGVAGKFLDLIMIRGANSSGSAVSFDVRMATAGGIQDTITVPAGNTIPVEYLIPIPADEQAAAITVQVQGADVSDSPLTISAIAIQNS